MGKTNSDCRYDDCRLESPRRAKSRIPRITKFPTRMRKIYCTPTNSVNKRFLTPLSFLCRSPGSPPPGVGSGCQCDPGMARACEAGYHQSVRRDHSSIQGSCTASLRTVRRNAEPIPPKNSLEGRRTTPQLARFSLTVMCHRNPYSSRVVAGFMPAAT